MTDNWLQSALTNDVLVAELLLRVKHFPDSDSLRRPSPSATTTSTAITTILPPRWGHRKNRSKSTAPTTATVTKRGKEHRGSPTTHLSWSGGGSSSDGYDESSRPSDLSSGGRSVKVNEGASSSSYCKSSKRKIFLNEQELTSMSVTLNQQLATCENSKRIKIDLDQNQRNKMRMIGEHETKLPQSVQITCRVEAETVGPQKGFVLPDLNMTPNEEDLTMIS